MNDELTSSFFVFCFCFFFWHQVFRSGLYNKVNPSWMWLYEFKFLLTKLETIRISVYSVTLTTLQHYHCYMWLVADMLDTAAAAAKWLQSCPTLCNPIEGSPPGSPVPGILQARTLEWVAISFSNAWKWKVKAKSFSRVQLLATPWTVAYQAPLSIGFSRQEYWSGLPLPFLMLDTIDKITSKNHRKFYCTELI